MISDSFKNLKLYQSIVPYSKDLFKYFDNSDFFSLGVGGHQIVKDTLFVIVEEYQTKSESEKKWESHRKFIDIHIILEGEENVGYSPISLLKPLGVYDQEADAILYQNSSDECSRLFLPEKNFCIFYPEDAHKPGLYVLKEQKVKKAVIKVSIL